ncbi:MAG: sugar phosphate isomerase/epimerase [Candidatus Hydrogenedentes bacterium]|nr:sugar phosphate isomerase/epimerase [Candidatus Hydrogenedentota bacterium]
MPEGDITYTVFTKAWTMPIAELGEHVRSLGFTGIELPVRPGFQVEPEHVGRDLPKAAKELAKSGVSICSIAGPSDEATIVACAEAGVPVIRVMADIGEDGYMASHRRQQEEYDGLIPVLDRCGVRLGVQNHCGNYVVSAIGLRYLVEKYDPKHMGIVWDAAHEALCGNAPEHALDIVWSHLCMVNLKNAFWRRTNGPEAPWAEWTSYWTLGRHGLASWPRVIAELKRRCWEGPLCLTIEYSDRDAVNRLAAEDLAFTRSLFESDAG